MRTTTEATAVRGDETSTLAASLTRLTSPTIGEDGRPRTSRLVRDVAYRLALGEAGPEPQPDDYSDETAGVYAETFSRWLDVVEAVAVDKEPTVQAVLTHAALILGDVA